MQSPSSRRPPAIRAFVGTLTLVGQLVFNSSCLPAVEPSSPGELPRYVPTPTELREGYGRSRQSFRPPTAVYRLRITPHWFDHDTRFWYRNDLRGGTLEFILVDVERGTRKAAFDHARLATALSRMAGTKVDPERLPFDAIDFGDDARVVRFKLGDVAWECDLASYTCSRSKARSAPPSDRDPTPADLEESNPDPLVPPPEASPQQRRPGPARREAPPSPRSPDGQWVAFVKDHNLFVRPAEGGPEIRLSEDGKEGLAYGLPQWSPDGKVLVAFRIEPGDRKEVYLIESSPPGGGRARLHTRPYALPGDRYASYELNLFQVSGPKQVKPPLDRIDFGFPRLRWSKDSRHFTYEKVDRGHQRFRLIEVDARTGAGRNLIDERSKTFIWTAHAENIGLARVNWLENTEEILYASERDGWRHLYLIDGRDGKVKNPVTHGEWVVRGIDRIDEDKRQVWFRASGRNAGEDPYFIHSYRVNFDGTGLVALTAGDGNHTVQFSPERRYLIDTYSRVDTAPVHALRRVSDGKQVCDLERADITDLKATGWQPPEVFVGKGRDGKTDIWGIVCRPRHLDPNKKYPVVESIYAGPQGSFVPKAFSTGNRYAALTELGFVVVQIDGMGTANRSKAFHDVCWQNLKDAGFPDRILWHQAVARKYPWYDTSRVGIYGTSAGGQNAAGALLFHPEFYQAAVAACGCHDNRMDKASWNEQWMGYPVGPQYAESSNITHAGNLRGKLLLIVGEMDTNVPPESTLRLVDALVKAGKDFELLVVPGMGHSNGGAYGTRRMQDFFVRHLHGVEPPERNRAAGG